MAKQQWIDLPALQIDVAKNHAVSIDTNRGRIDSRSSLFRDCGLRPSFLST